MSTAAEAPQAASRSRGFDVAKVRADFPILSELVHGKPLVYLDSANTSQKPLSVIKATDDYYRHANANIHRATHLLSERATALYEGARKKAATFLNAADPHTIVLTKGTTDGINLVAQSYGRSVLKPGDEILLSWLEHHSNIVPWQLVAEQTGAAIKVVSINDAGELDQDEYARLLSSRTKIVAVGHVSNALGTINPIKTMIAQAHAAGAVVLVDGAQAAPHLVDRRAGSRLRLLRAVEPQDVRPDRHRRPLRAQAAARGDAAVPGRRRHDRQRHVREDALQPDSLQVRSGHAEHRRRRRLRRRDRLPDRRSIARRRSRTRTTVLAYATARVREIPGARIIGEARHKTGVLSFLIEGVHPHDAGTILDQQGIAVRTGQHCAQPVMDKFCIPATIRASLAIYNTREDIDALVAGLHKVREVFA